MKIQPEELEAAGYVQFYALPHDQIIPFVKETFTLPTRARSVYRWVAFGGLALLFLVGVWWSVAGIREPLELFAFFGGGVSASLLLIPLHEWIHMWEYKRCGARQAKMTAHWKRFYFLATANRFVTSREELRRVALAPFLLITSLLAVAVLAAATYNLSLAWFLASVMVVHINFCSGDFAMMGFMEHRGGEVVLYDDEALKTSFFYEKRTAQP